MGAIISENPGFVIGKSVKEEQVIEESQGDFVLTCNDVYCHIAKSKPTPTTNLAFPQSLLYKYNFLSFKLEAKSTASNFIAKTSSLTDYSGASYTNSQAETQENQEK
jgi:hypothetical protein